MKIHLLSFGIPRLPGIHETILEYEKRIPKWCPFVSVEFKAAKQNSALPAPQDEKEIQNYLYSLKGSTRLWCLDEQGKSFSTTEWAESFKNFQNQSVNHLVLCIGNSNGIPAGILTKCDQKISFGKQTLGHEITRLVATEQIYRALSVVNGHPYHHA